MCINFLRKEKIIMGKLVNEFKEFVMRGNVLDLAVGVIIGGAFNSIVTSLCNDVIMPAVGWLIGTVSPLTGDAIVILFPWKSLSNRPILNSPHKAILLVNILP